MEIITPKIEIYRTRTFSEKLTDTFNFLRENWRPIMKYFLYLMVPTSIVLAFFMNHFMDAYMGVTTAAQKGGAFDPSVGRSLLFYAPGYILVSAATYILLGALVFSMVRLYRRREERLKNLTADEVKEELLYCLKRTTLLTLAFIGLGILYLSLAGGISVLGFAIHPALGGLAFMIVVALAIVMSILLMMAEPVYLLEDDVTILEAISKGVRLSFNTFGGMLAMGFVLNMLASVIQSFTSAPFYILYFAKTFFTLSNDTVGGFFDSFLYSLLQYFSCILESLGMLLSMVITTVGLIIQYGHACDKIDGTGVAQNIEKFDELDNF
jgi:hypothetical protein